MDAYHKSQATAIARERAKILAQDKIALERYRNQKLDISRGQLANQTAIAQARVKKLGAGTAVPGLSTQAQDLINKYGQEGADMTPPAAPASTRVVVEGNDGADGSGGGGGGGDGTDDANVSLDPGAARGGMIKKFARGGNVDPYGINGEMSLYEAEHYGDRHGGSSSGGNMFSSMLPGLGKGVGGLSKIFDKKPGEVKPTGPQGSGPGGGYTTADSQPGGVLASGSFGIPSGGGGWDPTDSGSWAASTGGMMPPAPAQVQAIDTGTTGPGSGFGMRAAPPPDARRARSAHG
jgi:hypothetical protein